MMGQWRTIDSAPTDWQEVDLWNVWQGIGERVANCRARLSNGRPEWHTRSDEYGWSVFSGTPTHWMPLPEPPAVDA